MRGQTVAEARARAERARAPESETRDVSSWDRVAVRGSGQRAWWVFCREVPLTSRFMARVGSVARASLVALTVWAASCRPSVGERDCHQGMALDQVVEAELLESHSRSGRYLYWDRRVSGASCEAVDGTSSEESPSRPGCARQGRSTKWGDSWRSTPFRRWAARRGLCSAHV